MFTIEDKVMFTVGLMDFSLSLVFWYLFLGLLNSIYSISGGLLGVALFFTLRLAVQALFSVPLGVLADREGVGRVLLALLTVFPLLTVLVYSLSGGFLSSEAHSLALLLVVALLVEALITAYNTLKYALPPRLVGVRLERVNAVFEATYSLLMIMGPGLAATLIHVGDQGLKVVLVLEASAIAALTLLLVKGFVGRSKAKGGGHVFRELLSAALEVKECKVLLYTFTTILAISAAGAIVNLALSLIHI